MNTPHHPDEYQPWLDEAVTLREDGDYEESVEKFTALFAKFPNNIQIAWEYSNALMKLNRPFEADSILGQAAKANPNDFHINKAWTLHAAYVADSMQDHLNAIARGRSFRATFPPQTHPESWQSLIIEIDLLWEIGLFDNLEFVLDENWDNFTTYPQMLPVGIHYYAKLFLNNKVKQLLQQSKPQAWANLPAESRNNLVLRTELALQVHNLVQSTSTRVFGIGQNCMPYLVGGPWGLKGARAHISDLALMDRAMFHNDTAAQAIENNFSEFQDPANYEFFRGFGRCHMPRHTKSGVVFLHERASFFNTQANSHFFGNFPRWIENWNNERALAKQKLYLFSFCGAGSLTSIINAAEKHLLDDNAHLLIIDVLQTPTACPPHPRVSYVHAPYPPDFIWDGISHYSKTDGFVWEMVFMSKIISLLQIPLSPAQSSVFEATQHNSFTQALATARAENNAASIQSILAVYMQRFAPEAPYVLEYANLLRASAGNKAASQFLANHAQTVTGNQALLSLAIEVSACNANWPETISLAEQFHTAFPPESEPPTSKVILLSLIAQYESGFWPQAHAHILQHWQSFTNNAELFYTALDFLDKYSYLETALALIGQSSAQAQQSVPQPALEHISARMAQALTHQNQLSTSNFNIIPLGQNTMASIILGRWGLRANRQSITTITPFDFGDFFETSNSQAIETNFNFLSNPANFKPAPVGVGGEIMVHPASGASFFLARRSEWTEVALGNFHQTLSAMVANWQSHTANATPIYFHIISQPGNLAGLLSAAQNHLLFNGAHLVIINTLAEPELCSAYPNLTYIHAPAPTSYNYYHLLHAATPEALAYEREILAPILSIINQPAIQPALYTG